jgi:hypothetical protein
VGRAVVAAVEAFLALAATGALALLGLRAAIRLDPGYDTWLYHYPFAAGHGRLGVPFTLNESLERVRQGFPQLPEFMQGVLWRLSGSVHAAGTINWIAFVGFLIVCQRWFRAPFFLVALVALTTPMILIHNATGYVDLFANALLATGTCTLAYAYLFRAHDRLDLLGIGLVGLCGAAWSRFQLTPLVGIFLIGYAIAYWHWTAADRRQRRAAAGLILAAALTAALPYLKNLMLYHNPFWPVEVPLAGGLFPFADYDQQGIATSARPPLLLNASRLTVFLHSFFEIGHPTSYPNRPRWTLDQGSGWIAFRSGGFWNVAVATYLLLSGALLVALKGVRGRSVAFAGVLLLGAVALMPQSNELRYYLFLPLSWAGLVGMLYPELKTRRPLACLPVLLLVGALFLHVSRINRLYFKAEPVGYLDLARRAGASAIWPTLKQGVTYCAVGWTPDGIFLTGPTMGEYRVVDRTDERACPAGSVPIRRPGPGGPKGGTPD